MRLKSPAKVEGTPVRIHKKCLTIDHLESIKELFKGYQYYKDGTTFIGYFHKPHQKL
jgi:GTP cyclohydrolase II